MQPRYPIKLYLKHPGIAVFVFASVAVNLLVWIWLVTQIPPEVGTVFLHYTVLFGVDEIGAWRELFAIPLGGLLVIAMNAVVGWLFFQKDKYIAYFLTCAAFLVQVFMLMAAFLLVTLNA